MATFAIIFWTIDWKSAELSQERVSVAKRDCGRAKSVITNGADKCCERFGKWSQLVCPVQWFQPCMVNVSLTLVGWVLWTAVELEWNFPGRLLSRPNLDGLTVSSDQLLLHRP